MCACAACVNLCRMPASKLLACQHVILGRRSSFVIRDRVSSFGLYVFFEFDFVFSIFPGTSRAPTWRCLLPIHLDLGSRATMLGLKVSLRFLSVSRRRGAGGRPRSSTHEVWDVGTHVARAPGLAVYKYLLFIRAPLLPITVYGGFTATFDRN